MKETIRVWSVVIVLGSWPVAQQDTLPPRSAAQQPSELATTISGEGGAAPRLAVPDFVAVSPDGQTESLAKTISDVLWDDLNFEREFTFVMRDTYRTIPRATSLSDVLFDRWRELNADGLIVGTVQKTGALFTVEMRLFNIRTKQVAYARSYEGANPRLLAHTMSDEIHKTQRALNGVARSKLAFDSDRDGERLSSVVESRSIKEIYTSDYDGENQRRVTVGRTLNIIPRWSPDGRSIAYTSYRRGAGNIFISNIFQGTLDEVTKASETDGTRAEIGENWLPAWSPDGGRLAFTSSRDGHAEIYLANRDGSGVRRLTNTPKSTINVSPTWSPSGTQIAFTSDRSGSPQIYIMGVDGLGLVKKTSESYCDRPTWSPAPYNEIAYASRNGPGFDIKVLDLASGQIRTLTFGEGTNESPAYAPNGRHLAFMSTRSGKSQVFTMSRDGKDVRQVTRNGNNGKPDWSQ
jgi:TolB protein